MKKNISIDDLFREGLSEGREQLNLGAWANMERMLDGKNPYLKEEDKKKRRIVPLFWIVLALLSTGAATAYYAMHSNKSSEQFAQVSSPHHAMEQTQASLASPEEQTQAPVTASIAETKPAQALNAASTSSPELSSPSTWDATNNISEPTIPHTSKPRKQKSQKVAISNTSLPFFEAAAPQEDNTPEFNATNLTKPKQNKSSKNIARTDKAGKTPSSKTLASSSDQAISTTMEPTTDLNTATPQMVEEKVPSVLRTEIVSRPDKSNKASVRFDTIEESMTTRMRQLNTPVNPRAVALNAEQEALAQRQVDLNTTASTDPLLASKPEPSATVSDVKDKTKSDSKKSGLGNRIQETATTIGGGLALAAQKITSKRPILYPALTTGVSMATSKQNYGGFQIGLSNLTQVNSYFTILADLKLFYRFNSGYAVKDYQTIFKGVSSIDTSTLASSNQNIYAYSVDSSVRKYNFKSMWSVEIPLSLQYHLRKFSFYAGINLAFNPGLNTTTAITSQKVDHLDTVAKSFTFVPSSNKNYQYATEDFHARWGMGYLFGASYAFNPRFYVDLRFTQTVWDNARTNSSRAISSEVYKVPYVQLSLGYRFKDFTVDR